MSGIDDAIEMAEDLANYDDDGSLVILERGTAGIDLSVRFETRIRQFVASARDGYLAISVNAPTCHDAVAGALREYVEVSTAFEQFAAAA